MAIILQPGFVEAASAPSMPRPPIGAAARLSTVSAPQVFTPGPVAAIVSATSAPASLGVRAAPAAVGATLLAGAAARRASRRLHQRRQCWRLLTRRFATAGGGRLLEQEQQEHSGGGTAATAALEPAQNSGLNGGELLVLCGPSGAGKSTLLKGLLSDSDFTGRLGLSVSHTTRKPREGEEDGVHYHFVSRDAMETMIAEGGFLEFAEVHGNIYGTSIGAIEDVLESGRVCVLDIDLQGMRSLRRLINKGTALSKCKVEFVLVKPCGGLASLEARLRARGADNEAGIRTRLETARRELEESAACPWDHIIVNQDGKLEASTEALRSIFGAVIGAPGEPWTPPVQETAPPEPFRKNVFAEFSGLARKLGPECVDLGQGFPNFDPPDFVVQALRDELESCSEGGPRTRHQYTRTMGHPPLVGILAERYSRHLGRELDPMKEVAITVGATNALFLALQTALARSGPDAREIVALEPFFELYRSQAIGLGASLRTVPLLFDETDRSFNLDVPALEAAIGPQTAALIVNSPHNPTGKAFSRKELEAIAEVVRRHPNVLVISDEVYKYMVFDAPDPSAPSQDANQPNGHIHFATLPDMWEQTVTVSSAGKTFGITGWQIGWCVGPTHWLEPIHRYMPNLQFCAPTLMQRALGRVLEIAAKPFGDEANYYEWLRKNYASRRSRMVHALEAAGVRTTKSQGGFFLLGDISALSGAGGPLGARWAAAEQPGEAQDWTFCRALATELGIVSLPVSPFFGPGAPEDVRTRFARFCFAKTDCTLTEAERRFARLSS